MGIEEGGGKRERVFIKNVCIYVEIMCMMFIFVFGFNYVCMTINQRDFPRPKNREEEGSARPLRIGRKKSQVPATPCNSN